MLTLRAAIIGFGLGGAVFHAPLVASTPGMTVAAIVTSDPERQRIARTAYPDATVFASADKIWAMPEQFDVVVVTTPNRWHAPLGIAALRAGLPVVIDKPLALTVQEVHDLIALSQETGKPVFPFQNRRWDGDFLTVRQLIQHDWLGPIARYESHFDRYRSTPKGAWRDDGAADGGGGLLYDLGSHLIDQVLQLFGPPQTVYAELPSKRPTSLVDDDSFIALECSNSVTAHLYFSQVARIAGPRFNVRGLRGTYVKYGLDPQEDALRQGQRPGMSHWGEDPRDQWGTLRTERDGIIFDGAIATLPGAYETFYRQVVAALTTGAPPPVTLAEAMLTQRVIEAARQSAHEHLVIHMTEE